jgi:hypothetical protein
MGPLAQHDLEYLKEIIEDNNRMGKVGRVVMGLANSKEVLDPDTICSLLNTNPSTISNTFEY